MKNALIVAAAVAAVLVTILMASQAMNMSAGTEMSIDGYAAMIAGVVLSLIVGIVLMVLVFYSSRRGYDEAVVFEVPSEDDDEDLPRR